VTPVKPVELAAEQKAESGMIISVPHIKEVQ
jgi:hypothetical protein